MNMDFIVEELVGGLLTVDDGVGFGVILLGW